MAMAMMVKMANMMPSDIAANIRNASQSNWQINLRMEIVCVLATDTSTMATTPFHKMKNME